MRRSVRSRAPHSAPRRCACGPRPLAAQPPSCTLAGRWLRDWRARARCTSTGVSAACSARRMPTDGAPSRSIRAGAASQRANCRPRATRARGTSSPTSRRPRASPCGPQTCACSATTRCSARRASCARARRARAVLRARWPMTRRCKGSSVLFASKSKRSSPCGSPGSIRPSCTCAHGLLAARRAKRKSPGSSARGPNRGRLACVAPARSSTRSPASSLTSRCVPAWAVPSCMRLPSTGAR
mmetsp:Transcript_50473/g.167169  ORF Transcript_50473/g.167169 Transcript_50473/m.167169 type:complete len:241 (-) Transcript_50473:518-1240(-)